MPRIRFRTSDKEVELKEGDPVNILRVAIRNECGVPWRCASGNCGTDRVLVEQGPRTSPSRGGGSVIGWVSCSGWGTGWPARATSRAT